VTWLVEEFYSFNKEYFDNIYQWCDYFMIRYCKFNIDSINQAVQSFYRQFYDTEFKLKGTYLTFCHNSNLDENPHLGKDDQLKDFFAMEIFDIELNDEEGQPMIHPEF
jgi:hypothetical protein